MKTVLEGIPEEVLGQECSNIETLSTKSNGEVKPSSEHQKHLSNPEYSPKTLADIQFKKEIQNFPDSNDYDQEYNQQISNIDRKTEKTVKACVKNDQISDVDSDAFDSEDSDDSRYDPLHFGYHNRDQVVRTDSSDLDSEEDSSDDDSLYPEDSVLKELRMLFTEDEKSLIDEFYKEMEGINVVENKDKQNALERIRDITNKYLEKGIRINSCCNNAYTVTDLILKKILDIIRATRLDKRLQYHLTKDGLKNELGDSNIEIIISICSKLLLKSGKIQEESFLYENRKLLSIGFTEDTRLKYDEIMKAIEDVAYKSIVNKNELAQDDFAAEIDNCYFYIRYVQGTIVKVARITNNQEIKALNLRIGILQIGESVIRIERLEEQRNYTDVPQGMIKMSFTTQIEGKAEKINIHLYPDKTDNKKIKVKLDQENQEKFNKLKDKSSLGKNCLLGGKSVVEAIQDKEFIRNHINEPDAPSTFIEQISISHIFDSLQNSFNQFWKCVLGG